MPLPVRQRDRAQARPWVPPVDIEETEEEWILEAHESEVVITGDNGRDPR